MKMYERIRNIARETGLKQYVLAERCGFSARDFSMIINGKKPLYADYLPQICKGLNITPDDLYKGFIAG